MADKLQIIKNVMVTPEVVAAEGREVLKFSGSAGFDEHVRELYKELNCKYPKFYKMDRLSKLAFVASELLVTGTSMGADESTNVAILLANNASTLDTDQEFLESISNVPSPAVFVYTLPNIAIGELCIRHGWQGENLFLVHDKFEAEEIENQVSMLFNSTQIKHCVCGWVNYAEPQHYKACLWMVSRLSKKQHRPFNVRELATDFSMY